MGKKGQPMLRAQIVAVMWMRDRRARFVAWAKQDDGQERSVVKEKKVNILEDFD